MGVIESECVHARTFGSRERAAPELFGCMERFCNRLRMHSALGWLSPAELEAANTMEDRLQAV